MPINILMPALSPTMEDGTLSKWLVKEGDAVSSGDILAEIETDKTTMEFEAVDEGVIGKILVADGTEGVKVNDPIAVLLEDGETPGDIADNAPSAAVVSVTPDVTPEPTPTPQHTPSSSPSSGERVFASPLARRIAQDKGIDLASITGSGPRGRIVKADLEQATPVATTPTLQAPSPLTQKAPTDPNTILAMYQDRAFSEVPLDGMRKTIAARLTEAKQTIPHFYLRRSVQIDTLLSVRAQINTQLAKRDIKLSVNDFIIKACAVALQKVPAANAVWAGDRILQLDPSDVAVAVAVEGGLFTPVLRDADQKPLSTLSSEMKDLAARAKDRKLAPHDYQGGSFAISNLGMFGIENFDAVINPPHGAILAVGAGKKQPVVGEDGEITVATMMSLTLSVDHRVIDGALGAELLQAIVDGLEAPMALLV